MARRNNWPRRWGERWRRGYVHFEGFTKLTGASESYEETLIGFIIGYFAVAPLSDLSNLPQGLFALFFIWEPSMGISRNLKQAIIAGVRLLMKSLLTVS